MSGLSVIGAIAEQRALRMSKNDRNVPAFQH
jgi:hypothetical protein